MLEIKCVINQIKTTGVLSTDKVKQKKEFKDRKILRGYCPQTITHTQKNEYLWLQHTRILAHDQKTKPKNSWCG
jgi:hypothetical protein